MKSKELFNNTANDDFKCQSVANPRQSSLGADSWAIGTLCRFKTQKSPDRIKNMPETKPQAKFFELRQATGIPTQGPSAQTARSMSECRQKEANYYMLIAGYRRSTSAFLKSGRTYYFNLEVFRELYPQEHELWDQVEQQAAAL
jgi:hypothetical protein